MTKSNKYWEDRFIRLQEAELVKGQKYYYELENQYRQAMTSIEKDISNWYQRFAVNNEISLTEAKQWLNSKELAEFKWDVKEYISYGQRNSSNQLWMQQLENASARVHISRLEALKLQAQQKIEVLYGNQVDGIDRLAKDIYQDGYYHTAYEVQKGFNVGYDLQKLNDKQLEKVISKPWTADNSTFKDKCWNNKQNLINTVHTEMTQAIIRGDSPDKAINTIAKQFDVSKNKAGRLIMTESAFFASAAQKDAFNTLDVEKYQVVATLDNSTSAICQGLDGEIMDMKDYQPGVTAPPFHPWCRTTTVPYFEDDFGERAARGEDGKTYYVPSNMKYKDWKEKFVDGGSKDGLKELVDSSKIKDNQFIPSKSIQDAEKFAMDLIGSEVSYKGMDLDITNQFNEGMFKTLNEFPQLKGFTNNLKVSRAKSYYGQYSTQPVTIAPDQIKIGTTLKFSNFGESQNIMNKIVTNIENDIKKNFHFKGFTPKHIAAHELAHAMENKIVYDRLKKEVFSVSEWNSYIRTLKGSVEARSITDQALKNMGINPIGREAYDAYKDLGKYAMSNRSEMMAQAISDALISDDPLPFSVEVLKETKKRLGGVQ